MLAFVLRLLWKILYRREASAPPCRPGSAVSPALAVEVLEGREMLSANPATEALPGAGWILGGEVAVQQMNKGNPNMVFLGDSITYGFAYGAGASIWERTLYPLGALDLAVPGQTTSNILFQLECGLLSGTAPPVVVLMIGTNNLVEGQTSEQTAEGIIADVALIHAVEPFSQVLVLGVPPNNETPALATGMTNLLTGYYLSLLPFAHQVTYANVGAVFGQSGSISNSILYDGVHPSALGYYLEMEALAGPLYSAYEGYYLNLLSLEHRA